MKAIETEKRLRPETEDELFVPVVIQNESKPKTKTRKRKQQREKTNAVAKFNNGLNTTALSGFTAFQMDVFWSLLQKMRDKGTGDVTIHYDEIERMTHYDRREKDSFHEIMIDLSDRLDSLTIKFEDSDLYEKLWLFQKFRLDKKNQSVTLSCNPQFEFLLNKLGKNFTRMELDIFMSLNSIYTKELYRHLMQFRNKDTHSGYWAVSMEDFREALSIPESYRMSHINSRIINVAKQEFLEENDEGESVFVKFYVDKYKDKGKGNKISRLVFNFEEYQKPLPVISMHNWLDGDLEDDL